MKQIASLDRTRNANNQQHMKSKENALLVIDPQNDFCDPKGSLFVQGAVEDMQRLGRFVMNNLKRLSKIAITLDSHRIVDISHPSGYVDAQGNPINQGGFVSITHQDVLDGKYSWTKDPRWLREYTAKLEADGEFTHFIWPEHCIIGSWGHNVFPALADAVHAWERGFGGISGAEYVTKGSHPMTEHFGAFQAQVPIDNSPGTQPNIALLKTLREYDNVYLAGEARSHCVGTTLKQILNHMPELAPKLVVLTDCMSDVPNPAPSVDFSQNFPPIADRARSMGTRFALSTDPIGKFITATV